MEKAKKKEKQNLPTKRLNLYLRYLVKQKGKNKQIAPLLGVTAAALGNYINTDREIPVRVIEKWKEVYKNDLLEESKNFDPDKNSIETKINKNKHWLEGGDYVGLHRLAWDEFKETRNHDRKIMSEISRNNTRLTKNNTELTHKTTTLAENITELVQKLLRQSGSDQ